MKIYLAGPIRGDSSRKDVMKLMLSILNEEGYEVLTEHVGRENTKELEKENTDREIYDRDIRLLEKSDLLIAEVTGPSFGTGFEVAYAAENGKETHLFYEKGKEVSAMVRGNSHPNVYLHPYSGKEDIESSLKRI